MSDKKPQNFSIIRKSSAARLLSAYFHENETNIKGSSVIGCGRWRAWGRSEGNAEILTDWKGTRMHGHFICNAAWTCDHCARANAAKVRSWFKEALLPQIEARALSGSMLTFTLKHSYLGDWKTSIDRLHDAFKMFDKNMKRAYEKIGYAGKFKTLEAPVGKNGIHGHLHVLYVHANVNMKAFEKKARQCWKECVEIWGGTSNEHGLDIQLKLDPEKIANYMTKHCTMNEFTASDTKKSKRESRTLGQLLDKAARGDEKAAAEWIRAIKALEGRARFHAGDLPKKMGICTPSQWQEEEKPEPDDETKKKIVEKLIQYPQKSHLRATAPDHPRAGLALILRVARASKHKQKEEAEQRVKEVVKRLCEEYYTHKIEAAETSEAKFEARMLAGVGLDLDFI